MAKTYSEWLPTFDYEVINAPTFSFTKMDENKKDYAYSKFGFLFESSKEKIFKKTLPGFFQGVFQYICVY